MTLRFTTTSPGTVARDDCTIAYENRQNDQDQKG